MATEQQAGKPVEVDPAANERRKFLGTLAAGAGAATLLAGLGASPSASAQQPGAQPPPPPGARPPPPPEPKVSQPPPLRDVKGKTVYITAASDGIGLGIARACSNAGMNVVIGYRQEARLAAALPLFAKGAPVFPVKHDVVGREGWVQMLEAVKGKYGKLHVVVNNAGIKTFRMASQATPEEWQNAIDVNFSAIWHSVAVCLPHMKEHNEGGHFVTTSSMSGLLPAVTAGVYTATKVAAVGIMEALRIELEGTNIGTSAFCPGGVNTDNYIGTGEENPFRKANPPPGPPRTGGNGGPPPRAGGNGGPPRTGGVQYVGMDPLEAGERVLNGIRNNDLFILSHPEFMPGMKERFDAILTSCTDEPVPGPRLAGETRTRWTGIYPREIVHRFEKRDTYRG